MISEASQDRAAQRPVWLVPVAILAVAAALLSFVVAGTRVLAAYRQTLMLAEGGAETALPAAWLQQLTPDQRLVLQGDFTARDPVARQVALWQRWPTNRVYFHNALSAALVHYETLGTNDMRRYEALRSLVEKGRPLDPDNARLDWVLAAKLMDQSCTFKSTVHEATAGRGATVKSEMIVSDRAKLDEAMRLLASGLERPTYRRYARELMAEREAIVGPARDLSGLMRRLVVASGTSLPDVTVQRNLARGATAYASLLLAEGRTNEAAVYLGAWKPLALRANEDAFTLIDVLVVGAIFKEAEIKVPELVRAARGPVEAARVRGDIAALTEPIREWRERRDRTQDLPADAQRQKGIQARSGLLLSMLLANVGALPTEAETGPSRRLDYVLLDHACFGGLSVLLTLELAGAVIVALVAGRSRPAALPPFGTAWGEALRAVAWAVILPLAVYGIVVWLTPLGGRGLGLARAWPKAVMQAGLLGIVVLLALRYRCLPRDATADAGGIARIRRLWRWGLVWALAACAAISLFPATWLYTTDRWGVALAVLPFVLLIAGGLPGLGLNLWSCRRDEAERAREVRASAVAIPALALAVLVLNLGARGLLKLEERRLVASDTLLQVDADAGGFTTFEARVARDLRDGVLQAAALRERK